MARVKRGTTKLRARKELLKKTKGYRFGRKNKEREAREAMMHAGAHAFAHRRDKKNDFRRLWTIRINAAVRQFELSYSKFIDMLNKKNVGIDRKILADLAENNPETFERVVNHVK